MNESLKIAMRFQPIRNPITDHYSFTGLGPLSDLMATGFERAINLRFVTGIEPVDPKDRQIFILVLNQERHCCTVCKSCSRNTSGQSGLQLADQCAAGTEQRSQDANRRLKVRRIN